MADKVTDKPAGKPAKGTVKKAASKKASAKKAVATEPAKPAEPVLNRVGRIGNLTPEAQKLIVDRLEIGMLQEQAALSSGIPTATYYYWLKRGRNERDRLTADLYAPVDPNEEKYLEFLEAVERARAQAVARYVTKLHKIADKNVTAITWWLERALPKEYGAVTRLEHSGKDGAPITIETVSTEGVMSILNGIRDADIADGS